MIAPTFDVVGLPAPQGNKSAMMRPGMARPVLVEGKGSGREKHKTWRQAVMVAAQDWLTEHPQPPIDEPITLVVLFRMPRGETAKYRSRHVTSPDLDKMVRSVGDSLTNSQLIRDDSRIWQVIATKRYVLPGELPGCTVAIELDGEAENADREVMKAQAAVARRVIKATPLADGMLPL